MRKQLKLANSDAVIRIKSIFLGLLDYSRSPFFILGKWIFVFHHMPSSAYREDNSDSFLSGLVYSPEPQIFCADDISVCLCEYAALSLSAVNADCFADNRKKYGMCIVLLGGLLLFVISGISAVNFECFFREDLFTGGATGFYSAVSLLYFAVGGSYIITDFAPKIKNSSAIIVRVICGVTMGVCLLYMLVGVVASGTLPVSEVAGKTLTSVAREIFPDRGLYTFFVVGACIGALVTTLNSSFVWYSNSLLKPCQDGYLPRSWAKCNRFGVPYILMTIFYVYGLIPVVMGLDLTILSQMAIGLTILSICIPMAGIIKLPEKHRELWEQSGYARKYPKWRRISMAVLTYLVLLTQVYALMANNPFWSNVLIAIYVGAVLLVLTGRRLLIKKDR